MSESHLLPSQSHFETNHYSHSHSHLWLIQASQPASCQSFSAVRGSWRETDSDAAFKRHTEGPRNQIRIHENLPSAISFRLIHQEQLHTCQRLPRPNEAIITVEKTNRHYPRRREREREDMLFHFRHESCVTRLKLLACKEGENEGRKPKEKHGKNARFFFCCCLFAVLGGKCGFSSFCSRSPGRLRRNHFSTQHLLTPAQSHHCSPS